MEIKNIIKNVLYVNRDNISEKIFLEEELDKYRKTNDTSNVYNIISLSLTNSF